MRYVTRRTRWVLIAVGLAVAIAAAVLLWPDTPEMFPMGTDRGSKTWVIQPGEVLSLSADEVHPDNVYRCAGDEGVNVEGATDGTATVFAEGRPGTSGCSPS